MFKVSRLPALGHGCLTMLVVFQDVARFKALGYSCFGGFRIWIVVGDKVCIHSKASIPKGSGVVD